LSDLHTIGDTGSLVNVNKKLLKMAIEIVDDPMKNGGSFHSYVNVYQRVNDARVSDKSLVDHSKNHPFPIPNRLGEDTG